MSEETKPGSRSHAETIAILEKAANLKPPRQETMSAEELAVPPLARETEGELAVAAQEVILKLKSGSKLPKLPASE